MASWAPPTLPLFNHFYSSSLILECWDTCVLGFGNSCFLTLNFCFELAVARDKWLISTDWRGFADSILIVAWESVITRLSAVKARLSDSFWDGLVVIISIPHASSLRFLAWKGRIPSPIVAEEFLLFSLSINDYLAAEETFELRLWSILAFRCCYFLPVVDDIYEFVTRRLLLLWGLLLFASG